MRASGNACSARRCWPVMSLSRLSRTSSVISSSSKTTTSLMERTPRFRSSPMARISRITMGERESAFSTRSWPRSMRLAISTSPSRVSSGTVPISRRYMRTGSLVFSSAPGVRSSSTSSPASMSGSYFLSRPADGSFGSFEDVDSLRADGGQQVLEVLGRMQVVGKQVVDLVVGQVALLLACIDQFFDIVEFVVKSQSEIPFEAAKIGRQFLSHTTGSR